MQISNSYVAVVKVIEPPKGEFRTVEVQDDFVYRGKVKLVPEAPIFMGNKQVGPGDIILFAKYSPDTHEVDFEDEKVKFVKVTDILAVL